MYKNIYKEITIKNKMINHIMTHGNKNIVEKLMLKSYKELQKKCCKNTKNILKLSLLNTLLPFKVETKKKKKKK